MRRTANVPQRTASAALLVPVLTCTSDDEVLPCPVVAVTGALDADVVRIAIGSIEVATHVRSGTGLWAGVFGSIPCVATIVGGRCAS
jgi:hypothetical protein